ncbi:MAG: hypothetical protein LBK67_11285 [Coriobacteriales bacterium]|jgi:hypothetical protein|nr:hypothetical protein [Coriobacteriales bacterium]
MSRKKRRKLKPVKNVQQVKGGMLQRRRLRTALALVAAFVCLFTLLSVQQDLELSAATPSALDYLVTVNEPRAEDPLGITSQNLELVGVSGDGMIIGYATEYTVSQTMAEIDRAMRAKGWSTLEMSAEGISSYVWQGEAAQVPSASQMQGGASVSQMPQAFLAPQTTGAYVMFVCSERDGGSSVVAEFL